MEVSLSEDAKKVLQQAIDQNSAEDKASDYLVGHYVDSIYQYLRYLEVKYAIPQHYLDEHEEVNAKMRSILVDWLVQGKRYKNYKYFLKAKIQLWPDNCPLKTIITPV